MSARRNDENRMNKKLSGAALTVASVVIGTFGFASMPTAATQPGKAAVHAAAHFDLASGQTPESAATEPDGSPT